MSHLTRPEAGDHNEFFSRYVRLVPDGEIVETLATQLGESLALLQSVPEERETYRYADDKWSVREVIGHLIDVERTMTFRAMSMARVDGVDLPGMDADAWAERSNAHRRPLDDLASEWGALRRATVHFFATLSPEAVERRGKASGFEFAVRAFPWIIAGHELWHRGLLVEDYGLGG